MVDRSPVRAQAGERRFATDPRTTAARLLSSLRRMANLFQQRAEARELVLSPQERLVAGGPAEELEKQIQTSLRQGVHRIVVDMRKVPEIDSAGVRALVRGHTTSERLGRQFLLVRPNEKVREVLRLSLLEQVFTITDSVSIARARPIPWAPILTGVGVTVIGMALVAWELSLPQGGIAEVPPASGSPFPTPSTAPPRLSPFFELAKLVVAAAVGILVTIVQRYYRSDRTANPTLEQAQVLLCVSGALMMIIIGSSLARAFGIAGAASIIRFRTPVEDARDITVLFILMGLGMAAGLGGFAVAGLGTVFLCAMFPILNTFASARPRQMIVDIEAKGREIPVDHIQRVFAVNRVGFEPREVSQGDDATARYLTTLAPTDSLEELSNQLMDGGKAGIKNVSWSPPKRS
jgi:anti-anti-sigma factor